MLRSIHRQTKASVGKEGTRLKAQGEGGEGSEARRRHKAQGEGGEGKRHGPREQAKAKGARHGEDRKAQGTRHGEDPQGEGTKTTGRGGDTRIGSDRSVEQ